MLFQGPEEGHICLEQSDADINRLLCLNVLLEPQILNKSNALLFSY